MLWLLYSLVLASGVAYFVATVRVYFGDRRQNPFLLLIPFWFLFYPDYHRTHPKEFAVAVAGGAVGVMAVIGGLLLSF